MEEQPKRIDTPGIASLVLGIISIVLCFLLPFVGLICGIIAIVMAHVSKKHYGPNGFEKAGRICGIIGIILFVVAIILIILLLGAAVGLAMTSGIITVL